MPHFFRKSSCFVYNLFTNAGADSCMIMPSDGAGSRNPPRTGDGAIWSQPQPSTFFPLLSLTKIKRTPSGVRLIFERVKKVFLTRSQTRTAELGSRLKRLHPAARIICALFAHKFHTCRAFCVLSEVHAPGQNRFTFYSRLRARTLRGFLTVCFRLSNRLYRSFIAARSFFAASDRAFRCVRRR